MPSKDPIPDEFEVRENEVIHRPTNARWWAYPGNALLAGFNHGRLGNVLPDGNDYRVEEANRIAVQLLATRPSVRRDWKCPICAQTVVFGPQGPIELPEGYFEACKLRKHMVGDECIAFSDLETAMRLWR